LLATFRKPTSFREFESAAYHPIAVEPDSQSKSGVLPKIHKGLRTWGGLVAKTAADTPTQILG